MTDRGRLAGRIGKGAGRAGAGAGADRISDGSGC